MNASLTRRISPLLGAVALTAGLLLGLATPQPAHAIDKWVDTLIDIVINAADPSLAPAKPLIICAVDAVDNSKDPLPCMKSAAVEQAKKQAGSLVPFNLNDNRIQKVITVVKDVREKNWLKAVDDGGPVVIQTVACALLPPLGPLKGAACSIVGYVITHDVALLEDVNQALKSGPNWGKLITLIAGEFGPEVACNLIPDQGGAAGAFKDMGCGVLIKALNELGKFAKGGVKAAKDGLISFGEELGGQTKNIPPEEYYGLHWYYLGYVDTIIVLRTGKHRSYSQTYNNCVDYFETHTAAKSTAKKWCDKMQTQITGHVDAAVQAIKAAVVPYYEVSVKPQIPRIALDRYYDIVPGKPLTGLPNVQWDTGIPPGSRILMIVKFPFSLDPIDYSPSTYLSGPPYHPVEWANGQVMEMLNPALLAYKQQVLQSQIGKLAAAGCKTKAFSGNPMLYFECDTWDDGPKTCKSLTTHDGAAKGHDHCQVNAAVASPKLAKKIAAELGAKRCTAVLGGKNYVVCSRPWKKKMCEALVEKYQGKVGEWDAQVTCEEGPKEAVIAFAVMTKQAKDIVSTLNGWKKGVVAMKADGKTQEKACGTYGFDPFAISCPGNPKAPAEAGVTLPACAPDQNKDGADAPCYHGPYSPYNGPAAPKADAALPSGKSDQTPLPPKTPSPRGVLPQKVTPPSGSTGSHLATARAPQGLPDITSAAQITIGSTPAQWGTTVNVDAKQAFLAQNGVCQFAVQHTARNIGLAPTGSFDSLWKIGLAPGLTRTWGSIAPGGQDTQKDLLSLKPGMNDLLLTLDHPGKVQEASETNNQFRVRVNLSGNCGAAPGMVPPPAGPGSPASPRMSPGPPTR